MPSAADIKRWERLYGLDKPWYQAYFVWLGNVVRGDLGLSIPQNNKPVAQLTGLAFSADGSGRAHIGTNPAARADAIKRVPEWLAR